jgi:Flp pilus assembly protein TadG
VKRATGRFWTDSGATSALEFGLVALPLLLLILGTVEYGRLLWTRQAMQSLAISTARCMGVLQTGCAAAWVYSAANTTKTIVTGAGALGVTITASNVQLNNAASCGGSAGFSSATVTYSFATYVPALILALAGGTALTVTACFPNQS